MKSARQVVAPDFAHAGVQAIAAVKPDIGNLEACVEDARRAALDADEGPPKPLEFAPLRGRLQAARQKLPPLYRKTLWDPYVATLEQLGESGFVKILMKDPAGEGTAGLMLDIAQAVVQNGEDYQKRATDGFQEVVSDLYDGFLSAEDRKAVRPPEAGTIPPLVKWGNPDFGPYTWTADAVRAFGIEPPIVNLPPANARRGLLAWSALGHETAGHDILHADAGLLEQLGAAVHGRFAEKKLDLKLATYWADRIDETASDVLGVLNLGPAAGIGLIGYFRALNGAYIGQAKLRSDGPANDPHPADILRGFLAAACVKRLEFSGAKSWADLIQIEAQKDVGTIVLAGANVSEAEAVESADAVAEVVMGGRMQALEMHPLGYIQNWRDTDEAIAQQLRGFLATVGELPNQLASGVYAAHAVAAAVTAALAAQGNIELIFDRMLALLKRMHDANPSWGPLYVRQPGNLVAHYAYINHA